MCDLVANICIKLQFASSPYRGGGQETQYTFTKAFGENATQKDVFKDVGLPLVTDLLMGHNSLLFMYGVTGSGKKDLYVIKYILEYLQVDFRA